jgi:hypothetical protein
LGAIATGLVDEARRLRAESPAVPVDALGIGLRRYRWGDGREEKEVGFRHDNVDFARDVSARRGARRESSETRN